MFTELFSVLTGFKAEIPVIFFLTFGLHTMLCFMLSEYLLILQLLRSGGSCGCGKHQSLQGQPVNSLMRKLTG